MSTNSSAPIHANGDTGIAMIAELYQKAIHSRFGRGQIWGVAGVAVGDDKTGPYEYTKAVRFEVHAYLTGGEQTFNPEAQGYVVVFEMVNRKRALKEYKDDAAKDLDLLTSLLAAAQNCLESATTHLNACEQRASTANTQLQAVQNQKYETKKSRREAERPLKREKREADSALRAAKEKLASIPKKISKLQSKQVILQKKLDDPVASLTESILATIGRLDEQRANLTDDDLQMLENRLSYYSKLLEDPVKLIMSRYRHINLRGITSLTIRGQRYIITTPPQPALPGKK